MNSHFISHFSGTFSYTCKSVLAGYLGSRSEPARDKHVACKLFIRENISYRKIPNISPDLTDIFYAHFGGLIFGGLIFGGHFVLVSAFSRL